MGYLRVVERPKDTEFSGRPAHAAFFACFACNVFAIAVQPFGDTCNG